MATIIDPDGNGGNTLIGTPGDDIIVGNDGNDIIDAGAGNDQVNGGSGDDTIRYSGSGVLTGGAGADTFVLSATAVLAGNAPVIIADFEVGADVLDVSQVTAALQGAGMVGSNPFEQGWARLIATPQGGSLVQVNYSGNAGTGPWVTLAELNPTPAELGAAFANRIGTNGNDVFEVSGGSLDGQLIAGNEGIDTLLFTGPVHLGVGFTLLDVERLNMAGQTLYVETANEVNLSALPSTNNAPIELVGTPGDIVGNASANSIVGTSGNDTIRGGGGRDRLIGGEGDDRIEGGEGREILIGGAGNDQLFAGDDTFDNSNLNGGPGNDLLVGSNGGDFMIDSSGTNRFFGRGGSDRMIGQFGNDFLDGGDGIDVIEGGAGDDVIIGGEGDDIILAAFGDADFDVIDVGPGNDSVRLTTGANGHVTASGGSGRDTYTLVAQPQGSLAGRMVVSDFVTGAGGDLLDLGSPINASRNEGFYSAGNAFDQGFLRFVQAGVAGADVSVEWDRDGAGSASNDWVELATLRGTNASSLTIDNFVAPVAPNFAPTVAVPLPDQAATEDAPFSFTVPNGSFADPNAEDQLTYTAWIADAEGSMPHWLHFDPVTLSFFGTPHNPNVGSVTMRVTATDTSGASVFDDFTITVANTNDAPQQTVNTDQPDSFAGDGRVRPNLAGEANWVTTVVALPGGKLVVAGNALDAAVQSQILARYNADGSIDTSFAGGSGALLVPEILGSSFAIQGDPSGPAYQIVTFGESNGKFAMARYSAEGVRDLSFGGAGGIVTTEFAGFARSTIAAGATDGSHIIAAGTANVSYGPFVFGPNSFAVARYDANGVLDPSFGNGTGVATASFFGSNDNATSMAVRADGRILVAGMAADASGSGLGTFGLVQFTADGNLDPSFGQGTGKVTVDFAQGSNFANAVVIHDGKIIVAGGVAVYPSFGWVDLALARLNGDGSPDTTFGDNGRVVADFSIRNDMATAIVVQNDGKILVLGSNREGKSEYDVSLARFNTDGSLDLTFGSGKGVVATDIAGGGDFAQSLTLQADGTIVVGGGVFLARYNPDGSLKTDESFALTEDSATSLTVTHSFHFDDPDLGDTHVVTATGANGNALGGSLAATLVAPATGASVGAVDWTYTLPNSATQFLAQGQQAAEHFVIHVSDGDGGVINQPVEIVVTGVNDNPIAADDSAAVLQGASIVVPVLGNDADIDAADTFSVTAVGAATGGTVTIDPGTSLPRYTANSNFAGTDSFTYTVTDSHGATGVGTVNVTVTTVAPGDAGANAITGTTGADVMSGGAGNDTLNAGGGTAADFVDGGTGDDTITGGGGGDTLIGGPTSPPPALLAAPAALASASLSQRLVVQAIATGPTLLALAPETDNDTFLVAGTDLAGDKINGGDGIDTLRFTSAVRLDGGFSMTNVEQLNMAGFALNVNTTAAVDLSALTKIGISGAINGNLQANTITGTQSDDTIDGGAANDVLSGAGGNDALLGGQGNDTLNGGIGADTLQGGQGTDTLDGGEGNDILTGGADADILRGGTENDTFRVAGAELTGDTLDGGAGNDTLQFTGHVALGTASFTTTSVETLDMRGFTLTVQTSARVDLSGMVAINPGVINGAGGTDRIIGTQSADRIVGGNGVDNLNGAGGNDTLAGGAGNDVINGGLGNDALTADSGNDTFVFNTALNAATNMDTITGFNANAADKMALDPAIFAAIGTAVETGEFRSSVGGNAADLNDFILFDSSTGSLFYDADGNGAGAKVQFIKLVGLSGTLDASDFTTALPPSP